MGVRLSRIGLAVALLAVGLLAASPFLTGRLVGTGEAFNYDLSVADAVVQMRHGIVPPLAGQTQYAFNGRIHPLRNAPYLYYLAAAVDAATLRRLQFWELQNVSLTLSLVSAVFACYLGLRWATGCPRSLAFFLAAAYGLSPSLLCLTHSLNLFMTVHAAVFVPLAIAACVRGCREPSLPIDLLMAAALALAWLAHPPVALWLTWGVMLVRIVSFADSPGWRPLARGAAAAVVGILLAGFGFASVGTVNADLKYFSANPGDWVNFANIIMSNLRLALPGALLPVSRAGNEFADLQFGYVAWGLMALTVVFLVQSRGGAPGPARRDRIAAWGICLVVVLLLVLTFPIPGVTWRLWQHMPMPVLQMTFLWPMQRLYIVAVGFTAFGAALALPAGWPGLRRRRWLAPLLMACALGWTLYEAVPLISIGFANRRTPEGTKSAFRPANLDLTQTSYSYFGVAPTFVNGVDDPRFNYRLLGGGNDEIASNYSAALSGAPVVQRGSITVSAKAHETVAGKREITLLPGHCYMLSFDFKTPPFKGWIELVGPLLRRFYTLPEAGAPRGFGMLHGQRRAISISTDSDKPERVALAIGVNDGGPFAGREAEIADFVLQDVPMDELPVRQDGYLPLRLEVNSPQAGCTVETPQRYIHGYAARVDGRPVPVLMSPWRNVMVGVPAGRCIVEISYEGSRFARAAFWVSALCWALFLVWLGTGSRVPAHPVRALATLSLGCCKLAWRLRFALAAAAAAGAATLYVSRRNAERQAYLGAVGPFEVKFQLAFGSVGTSQPLVSTGHPKASAIISAALLDEQHVRIDADVQGTVYSSLPIETDYSRAHTLVVSDSALYPLTHPVVAGLPAGEAQRLRRELRVELDGYLAIGVSCYAYEAAQSEIFVGSNPFGTTTAPVFSGEIIGTGRLAIPRNEGMPRGGRAHLKLRFPSGASGAAQPLVAFDSGAGMVSYSVTYLGAGKLKVSSSDPAGGIVQSADIDADLSRTHSMNFWPSAPAQPRGGFDLSCDFDGQHILGGPKPLATAACPVLSTGASAPGPDSPQARLPEPGLDLLLTSRGTSTGRIEDFGPFHMTVTLPAQKTGRHEPILTTGRTGAGDVVYIVYEDEQHVRVGFDHWAVGGTLSDPIAIDYKVPHEIWVTEGSLYPSLADDALWGAVDPQTRASLKGNVTVVIDGKTAISEARATYPSKGEEVTFASNRIGASTADAAFSGIVHDSERTGSVMPPGLKL